MALLMSDFRLDLASAAARPVLIRTPKTRGYQKVIGVSVVQRTVTALYPEENTPAEDNDVNLLLEDVYGANVVGPGSVGNFPDMANVLTGYQLRTLIPDIYDDYRVVCSTADYGELICDIRYRRGTITEAGTNVAAYVFYMNEYVKQN